MRPREVCMKVSFSNVRFINRRSKTNRRRPRDLPSFTIGLMSVFGMLSRMFPRELMSVRNVLSTAVAVRSLRLNATVLAVNMPKCDFFACSPRTFRLSRTRCPTLSFFRSLPRLNRGDLINFFFIYNVFRIDEGMVWVVF